MPFISNKGQLDDKIKFYTKISGGIIFFTKEDGIIYSQYDINDNKIFKIESLQEEFVGGKIQEVKGGEKSSTQVAYLKGSSQLNYCRNITVYEVLSLGELYKGIEIVIKKDEDSNKIEKNFYLKPGASLNDIRIRLKGAKSLQINKNGELEVKLGIRTVNFTKPQAYEVDGAKKRYLNAEYEINGDEYRFKVRDYDLTKGLVIDPFFTFVGGSNTDYISDIYADNDNNVYVAGWTWSLDFPLNKDIDPYDLDFNGNKDSFILKFDGNLQTLLLSTFIGGSGDDSINELYINDGGEVFVAGQTQSPNFPITVGAFQPVYKGGTDGFIAKLDNNLQYLLASTYLGGFSADSVNSVYLDDVGTVYVAGNTNSYNFTVTDDAFDPVLSSEDGFISKLDNNLQYLFASTYLGGSNLDSINDIAIDSFGNIIVAGRTWSFDFPRTTLSYDTSYNGNQDGFVSKLDNNLNHLLASTYLGGTGADNINALSIDKDLSVVVAGDTSSSDFPMLILSHDASYNGNQDGFVSRLDNNLNHLLASTYLGGSSADNINTLSIDNSGGIIVAGGTWSSDFPVKRSSYARIYNGNQDSFIAKLDNNLGYLAESTYFGGGSSDYVTSLSINQNSIYSGGNTISSDLLKCDTAYNKIYSGGGDGFIVRFDDHLSGQDEADNKGITAAASCFILVTGIK
ncbi:MAG: SBBP repeat-containing protein [bacterium]